MTSKERYDCKRRHDPQRKRKERARRAIRTLAAKGLIRKRGRCFLCNKRGKTVWHHPDYGFPLSVTEVCYKCHRTIHPRPVPRRRSDKGVC